MSYPKPTPEQVINDLRRNVGHFVEDPYLRLGDADSGHGVIFGIMSDLGSVAVKPFGTGSVGKARREARMLSKVVELGLEALEPLAVAEGGLANYLVTRRRSGLRNLGQVDWNVNVAAKKRLTGVIDPTLEMAADTLAAWHNRSIFHGDAQVKNVTYDKVTGVPVYVDADGTQHNPSGTQSQQLAHEDVLALGTSVLWRGFLNDRSPTFRAGYLTEHLTDPYISAVTNRYIAPDPEAVRAGLQTAWIDYVHYIDQLGPPNLN